jgi:phage terminase large subunit-like protein
VAHVLADHSVTGRSPEGWAAAVAAAARAHGTCQVVAEQNQGGKMIRAVLHTADAGLRVKLVNATAGKVTRAEPVSHLFEAGRAFLHGKMPELEAQLLGFIAGGGYEGPGHSPDRADAMGWGLTELMLGTRREPKIWSV